MRLIDADALKESIGPIGLLIAYRDPEVKRIKNVIDNQPTAYDAGKVVEELQQMKVRYFLTIANTGNEILDKIYEEVGNSIDKAIVIMEGAVKE